MSVEVRDECVGRALRNDIRDLVGVVGGGGRCDGDRVHGRSKTIISFNCKVMGVEGRRTRIRKIQLQS